MLPIEDLHSVTRQLAGETVGGLSGRHLTQYYGHGNLPSGVPCPRAYRRAPTFADEITRPNDRPAQNASVGTYVPQTSRNALQTSPTVARARSASRIG